MEYEQYYLVFIFNNASFSLPESPVLLRNVRVLWFDASNPIPDVSENAAEVTSVFPPCSFSIKLVLKSTLFSEVLQNCLVVPAGSICRKCAPKFCWSSATVSFNKHLRKRWGFSTIKISQAYPPFKVTTLEDLPLTRLPVFPILWGVHLFPVCDCDGKIVDNKCWMTLPIGTGVVPHWIQCI